MRVKYLLLPRITNIHARDMRVGLVIEQTARGRADREWVRPRPLKCQPAFGRWAAHFASIDEKPRGVHPQ